MVYLLESAAAPRMCVLYRDYAWWQITWQAGLYVAYLHSIARQSINPSSFPTISLGPSIPLVPSHPIPVYDDYSDN